VNDAELVYAGSVLYGECVKRHERVNAFNLVIINEVHGATCYSRLILSNVLCICSIYRAILRSTERGIAMASFLSIGEISNLYFIIFVAIKELIIE